MIQWHDIMRKFLITILGFNFLPLFHLGVEAAMYDDLGNRIYGRQNHMRNGTYDPREIEKQFKTARESVQKIKPRSVTKKKKYISCDLSQDKKFNYKLNILKLRQGAPRKCREDVKYIINIPYKTKVKRRLRPYIWRTKR